jgi:hypothetical protein
MRRRARSSLPTRTRARRSAIFRSREVQESKRGTVADSGRPQEIYTGGDARRGVQTAAFNLPNDEFQAREKGSKNVLLKNVMDAKFKRAAGRPAARVLDPSLVNL